MPNGNMTCGNENGIQNVSLIIPRPGDSNQYYSFHGIYHATIGSSSGLYYSIIDMRLDKGLGDVTTTKDIKLHDAIYSGIAVIKHANNRDYWLLATRDKDSIYVYPVRNNGIGAPNKLRIFPNSATGAYFQQIKPNNKGNKVVFTSIMNNTYGALIYNFDRFNGRVNTGTLFFDKFDSKHSGFETYHAAFSPNDSMVYLSTYKSDLTISKVVQFQVYANNINATAYYINTIKEGLIGLQLAPNNKIYFSEGDDTTLNVIHFPNKKGEASGFGNRELNIKPGKNGATLPSLYSPHYDLYWNEESRCTDTVIFTNKSDTTYFKSFIWYFGDGDSSKSYHAKHAYKKPGKYLVTLVGINECNSKTWFSDSIEVTAPGHAYFKKDTLSYSCGKAYLSLNSNSQYSTYQRYSYDFGDSTGIDTSRNPAHIYTKSGNYTISQVAYNGNCSDTFKTNIQVNIEPFPEVAFTLVLNTGCTPFTFQPQNNSSNSYSYLWQIGNTKTDTVFAPVITLTDTGWHSIKLIAINNQGCKDTITKDSAIYVSPRPLPLFSFSQSKVCKGISISATNISEGATHYKWLFGDGGEDTAKAATHIYKKSGKYLLQLIAYNTFCSDTFKEELNILVPDSTKPEFTVSAKNGCPGLAVNFTNKSLNAISYHWDFGDGKKDTALNPLHIYPDTGTYFPSLITTNAEGCKDTFTLTSGIKITPVPVPHLTLTDSTIKCGGIEYTFSSNSFQADSLRWDFGDGTKAVITGGTVTEIKHTYTKSGSFSLKLSAFNAYCEATVGGIFKVKLRPLPIASFSVDTTSVCFGKAVKFTNASTEADSYLWDFGDGKTDTSFAPSHLYTQAGKYTVKLYAMSKEGCTVTLVKTNFIEVAQPFHAQISTSAIAGCAPLKVEFTSAASSAGLPLSYHWDFGDNNTSTAKNPTHTFTGKGIYTYQVKLVVSNGLCSDSTTVSITITNFDDTKDAVKTRLVTVESNEHVLLLWDKHPLAAEYEISRSIDGISFNPLEIVKDTFYKDLKADVQAASYWYKVIGKDACGGKSGAGNIARTIHLKAISIDEDEKSFLQWNLMSGFANGVAKYEVLKDNKSYNQTPASVLSFTDANFFHTDSATRCYTITAEENNSSNGLKSQSNEVCLHIKPKLWIPNVFTPNDDEINNTFEIKSAGLQSFHFTIYDRWGGKVFESNNSNISWDGKIKGTKAAEGVYLYMVSAQAAGGEWIYKKGTLLLAR